MVIRKTIKVNGKCIVCLYNPCPVLINPPVITHFAIMFVPTERLYAGILHRMGLSESLSTRAIERQLSIVQELAGEEAAMRIDQTLYMKAEAVQDEEAAGEEE